MHKGLVCNLLMDDHTKEVKTAKPYLTGRAHLAEVGYGTEGQSPLHIPDVGK
jgi:hypothetical protein